MRRVVFSSYFRDHHYMSLLFCFSAIMREDTSIGTGILQLSMNNRKKFTNNFHPHFKILSGNENHNFAITT